jgi:hypothetical protein
MNKNADINMEFRPDTYWPVSLTQAQLIDRISGKVRRDMARDILEAEGFAGLSTFLGRETLPIAQREMWGRVHPAFMGGEYLPPLLEGEVEIVGLSLASTTSDQISIRARREGGGIRYRIVNEYEAEGLNYETSFDWTEAPMTLAELVRFIDESGIPGDIYSGGAVMSNWACAYDGDGDVETAWEFVTIHSTFYPQLRDYYRRAWEDWRARIKPSDDYEECGD